MRALIIAILVWGIPAWAGEIATSSIGTLPAPVTNNAVAAVETDTGVMLYSFAGLGRGKRWNDSHAHAWAFDLESGEVHALPDVPGSVGRLASTAVSVSGVIYFFGGYTVAEDGGEVSTPEVFAFDPATERYSTRTPMPVPVDDAVALAYANRYIYLISGWHNSSNVNLTQVYDTETDTWFQATPYPGAPVFGHAGGIVGQQMVIADGVRIVNNEDGSRDFVISDEAWLGEISESDPARIRWRPLAPHPGRPLYRMAATGSAEHSAIIFAGGSDNPYNYDGLGYDGIPSEPSYSVFAFDLRADEWRELGTRDTATMDHRGLIYARGSFHTIGGMAQDQEVSDQILRFEIPIAD